MPSSSSLSLSIKELRNYRAFVFPDAVADKKHDPHFNLENRNNWITDRALACFRAHISEVTHSKNAAVSEDHQWEIAEVEVLEEYRNFILPAKTASHPFFGIDNADIWINDAAFCLFLGYRSSTVISGIDKKMSAKVEIKSEPSENVLGKRRAHSNTPINSSVISISSDSDDSRVPVKRPKRLSRPSIPRPKADPKRAIKITKKDSVERIISLNQIPTLWDVSRTPTAYLIDLSDDNSLDSSKSIISMIRHDEQSSWSGSSGHAKGDAVVINHFGEGGVLCRRAHYKCNGVKVCEYFDRKLLDGFEGWERDDSEMKPFWLLELDGNEKEFSDPNGPLSRFYMRILATKCQLSACNGKPIVREYSNKPSDSRSRFVGCTGFRKGDGYTHRYLTIDRGLDPNDVDYMIKHDGRLPAPREDVAVTKQGSSACSLVLHPRSHKSVCPIAHNINGEIKQGNIKPYDPCGSQIVIFEPLDTTIRKAIVIPCNPHNHPRHPHAKPTAREKAFVKTASEASGKTGISAKKLRTSTTTTALLDTGASWESQNPGMVDDQRVRKYLKSLNVQKFPHGLEWPGVMHYMNTVQEKLPSEERYIHTVVTKADVRLIVTMHPQIAKYIHTVRFLAIDYTFKRVRGDMNEWEVAGNIDHYKTRVTFASLYCNKATRDAFRIIFQEFFDVIKRITGRELELHAFNTDAKLRALLFDAEAAQMQACGDVLLAMNVPNISGIVTQDPQVMVQYVAKTCLQHFLRNIDELPKNVPRDVINYLKEFPKLESNEDIEAWHHFCCNTEHVPVKNWYNQKLMYPWYLPSVNRFLSPMKEESWNLTPDDTNFAETAHVARNAEGGIGRPLLAAILDAQEQDDRVVKRLEHYAASFTLGNRWNGPLEREKRSASRREGVQRKVTHVNAARKKYEEHEKRLQELSHQRQTSLEEKRRIERRLDAIKDELSRCSGVSMLAANLRAEQSTLKQQERNGINKRKSWSAEKDRIKEEMTILKENDLKNSRVRDTRPSSSPAPSRILSSPPPLPPSSPESQWLTSSPFTETVDFDDEDDLVHANNETTSNLEFYNFDDTDLFLCTELAEQNVDETFDLDVEVEAVMNRFLELYPDSSTVV